MIIMNNEYHEIQIQIQISWWDDHLTIHGSEIKQKLGSSLSWAHQYSEHDSEQWGVWGDHIINMSHPLQSYTYPARAGDGISGLGCQHFGPESETYVM